jgi:predicted choloylglycine hydrolase
MELTFSAYDEDLPGERWKSRFTRDWKAYRQWYLAEGIDVRPTYAVCLRQIKRHMPELLPTYERLCELAGGGDLEARFLSLYCPPAYLTGCSQIVWPGVDPILLRNYDYAPNLAEGLILRSKWNGRGVLAMIDCLWGVLDGINDAGLAISLTFGGRRVVGEGFGVPIILRYVLEFCETVAQARSVLSRVPSHMAYNVTLVDRSGAFCTAYLAPDREPLIKQVPIAANHQGRIDWHQYARATSTLERERYLFFRLQDPEMTEERLISCFLSTPLYTRAYVKGFGTLYTALYRPVSGRASFIWPDGRWDLDLNNFQGGVRHQRFEPDIFM